jgi:Predicted endonuclease distantly related to archaeal Holliday junction resolvase and Mrr-like restriction enzymes
MVRRLFKKNGKLLKSMDMESISDDLVDTLINIHEKEVSESSKERGRCFEIFLENIFKGAGYKSELTSYNRDKGIDLYVEKAGIVSAIQAKKRILMTTETIGVQDIKDFVYNVSRQKKRIIHKKIFITTHYFSSEAKELAKEEDVELIDKEGLVLLILQLQPLLLAKAYYVKMKGELKRCPLCGNTVVNRYSKVTKTNFRGCSNYPACLHKELVC